MYTYTHATQKGTSIDIPSGWSISTSSLNANDSVNAFFLSTSGTSSPAWSENKNRVSAKATSSAGLGTGFGQDKYSPVTTVDFEKEGSPSEVFSIYYNTRENLEAIGVEFRRAVYVTPSAFPNEDGYCERP